MPSSKPPITSTQHELPFSQLGWEQFERLCLRLVLAEGYVRAEHLGASGGEGGRDIVAWRDRQRVVFQCKRVKQFVAHDGIKEVNKLRSRPPQDQPDEIVFIIACPVSDQTRKGIRQAWGDEKTCLFWAGSELDSKVKKQEAILREFFGLSASAVSNIPFILPTADPGDFQGRKSELAHLVARLVPKKPAGSLRIVLVSGSAGVGKSVLVSRFANQYRNRFPGGVVGIRVNRGDAYSLAGELARSFGYPLDPDDDRPAHARVQELFACREALLILDNAEEAAIVRELLPSGGPCAVVIITQDRGLATALGLAEGATQHLRPLTKGEALALLEAILGDTRLACDRMNVDRLLMLTGCLPLAIRIVGATLREQSGRPLKSYVTSLEDSRLRLTRLRVHGDEELDVRASLFLSLDALDEASTFFFACASICGESGFALSVAGAAAAYDEDESWRCAGRLRRFSLLEVSPDGEERFMFHPLVRLFAREVAEVRGLLTHARERHARFLIDTVRDLPEKAWETKLVGDVEDILLAAEWLVESGQLDVDFGMRVGNLLDYLGRWKQAAFLAEQHAVLAKVHGNEDAATRFCIRHSKQLLHLGQVDAALERLVVLGEEPLKPIIKAAQLNTLGGALGKKGRTDEAIEAFQESLAIGRELNNRPHVAMTLNSLGGALRKKGRTDEAIEAFQKSLAIER
jgi:tetratricopeptide (TPR) repeat protein